MDSVLGIPYRLQIFSCDGAEETTRVETHFAHGLATTKRTNQYEHALSVFCKHRKSSYHSAKDERSGIVAIRLEVRAIMSVTPATLSDSFVSGGSMSAETNLLTQINMPVWPVLATLIIPSMSNRERCGGRFFNHPFVMVLLTGVEKVAQEILETSTVRVRV